MSKHIPGPWEVWGEGFVRWPGCKDRSGRKTHSPICSVGLPGVNQLMTITGGYGDYEQAKAIQAANARLIAASPAMLALLERFDALDTDPHVTDAEWSQFRRDVHDLFAQIQGDKS